MAEVLPFGFSSDFQEKMLALMLTDLTFAVKVTNYISEERLYSDGHKYLFNQIKQKVERSIEAPSMIEIEENLRKIERHKRRILKTFCTKVFGMKLSSSEIEFIKTKMTEYSKKSVFVDVFQAAQTYWNSKNHEEAFRVTMEGMNDLYAVDFKDDSDLDISDFEEARQIYLFKAGTKRRHIPTQIDLLDEILRGGLERGEMGILLAQAKKGKSIGLVHMGAACLMMRFGRVAHFVLEGTTEQTILRYQSRLSGIEYGRLESEDGISAAEERKLEQLGTKYMTNLTLIPFNQRWDYTVHDIDGKIRELKRHGKMPDLVVVDYGDLLKSKSKAESFRLEQTEVYRDLKKMAMIHDVALWTASQAQRPSEDPDKVTLLRARDIAESFEKCRIADLVATLNQTPREKNDGIMRLHLDLYRSNDGDRTMRLIQNFEKMIFYSKRLGRVTDEDVPSWMRKTAK